MREETERNTQKHQNCPDVPLPPITASSGLEKAVHPASFSADYRFESLELHASKQWCSSLNAHFLDSSPTRCQYKERGAQGSVSLEHPLGTALINTFTLHLELSSWTLHQIPTDCSAPRLLVSTFCSFSLYSCIYFL